MQSSAQLVSIAGFEKCWTSSFAGYLVENGMCDLLWPQGKEPHLFSQYEFHGVSLLPGLPVLDASVSYVHIPAALDRLAAAKAKILLFFRNPYDRAYSAFRMYRILHAKNSNRDEVFGKLKEQYPTKETYKDKNWLSESYDQRTLYRDILGTAKFQSLEKYLDQEIVRINAMNFSERLDYERVFLKHTNEFPFLSILLNSLFANSTKLVVERFSSENILPITVHKGLNMQELVPRLAQFIDAPCPSEIKELPRLFNLSGATDFEDPTYRDPETRQRHGEYFDKNMHSLASMLKEHGCDMRFFKLGTLLESAPR